MRSFSVASLGLTQADTGSWPQVDDQAIATPQCRDLFIRRGKAIKALLAGLDTATIRSETGLSRPEVIRLLKRCLYLHPDGKIYGFRALIPQTRLSPYTRRTASKLHPSHSDGAAGMFRQLLSIHPELASMLETHVFKLGKRHRIHESRIPIKSLHKRFIDKCRDLGLERGCQYPFSTKTLAYVSLATYVRHLLENPDRAVSGALGAEVAKKLRSGDGTGRPVGRPFERVECDAHHIDAIFCILIPSLFGEPIAKIVHRLWVVVIQEVMSKAILGYHLSFRDECNSDDVLLAVRNALTVWQPSALTVPGLTYGQASGLPSSQDRRFVGACWNEFSVDGAMANLASKVAEKLDHVVGARPIVLPRRIPNDRPFVERFFQALEESGFHRLPNTTGSGPNDPRRHDPERAALRYTLQVEHLEELLDILIANFNGTPHSSIGYRTPLAYLAYLCESRQEWPRQADPGEVARVLNLFKKVTVRGGIDVGRRPYVHFLGANYSSDTLRMASHWVGQKITIEVDVRDLRTVRAYAPNGAEIGILRAAPPWDRTPHTLEMRQAVNSLVRRKMIHYLDQDDPVVALLDHLETLARKGKAVPPLYLEARRLLAGSIGELAEVAANRVAADKISRPRPPAGLPQARLAING